MGEQLMGDDLAQLLPVLAVPCKNERISSVHAHQRKARSNPRGHRGIRNRQESVARRGRLELIECDVSGNLSLRRMAHANAQRQTRGCDHAPAQGSSSFVHGRNVPLAVLG